MVESANDSGTMTVPRFVASKAEGRRLVMLTAYDALWAGLFDQAGVDALQIFDSWGALCPDGNYWEASLRWIKDIIDALPPELPIILYAKGMAHHATSLCQTGSRVLSVDWKMPLHELRSMVSPSIALQGNLDPSILSANPEKVRDEAEKILQSMRGDPGHIFNLGHGILPEARIENVETLVETVHRFS